MTKKVRTTPKTLSLKEFEKIRRKVLIWHDKGGLGDVLMQRMMFKDFRKSLPDAEITFACLPEYMDAAKDNPFIDHVIDSRKINQEEYAVVYPTCVTYADRYENKHSPFCQEHRSDIWAGYCGFKLTSHEMGFQLPSEIINAAKSILEPYKRPIVLFAPVSKMVVKTLLPHQIQAVLDKLTDFTVLGLHNRNIPYLAERKVPTLHKLSVSEWLGAIHEADYIVSVDSAPFHAAGGMKKPLMGIFTFADGTVYGKYFDFVLVQLHRKDGNWDCGPCFKFGDCPKCKTQPKPCLTEISPELLHQGIDKMFSKWPI